MDSKGGNRGWSNNTGLHLSLLDMNKDLCIIIVKLALQILDAGCYCA